MLTTMKPRLTDGIRARMQEAQAALLVSNLAFEDLADPVATAGRSAI